MITQEDIDAMKEDGMGLVERLRDEAVYASPRFEKLFTEAASMIEQLERELAGEIKLTDLFHDAEDWRDSQRARAAYRKARGM